MFDAPAIDTTQAAEHRLGSRKPAVPRGYLALWAGLMSVATVYIVQVSLGDLPHDSVGYQTIFATGLTLLLITLVFNIAGHVLKKRYRQVY